MRRSKDETAAGAPERVAERDLLVEAARAAAPIALELFRHGEPTAAERWAKSHDQSLVTQADLAVNARLRADLMAARPDYGWLSEEDADGPARLGRRRLFVVDPIDGTRSFAEGEPEFCLSIAVVEDGAPIAAVIFAPALDELFDAALGAGARLNAAPIRATTPAALDGARILASRSSLARTRWLKAPPFERGHVHPIAYRMCLVAAGRWDGMMALKPTNEWDVAAGALILAEAGACVTDAAGEPFRFNKPTPRIAAALAAAPALHQALRAGLD